MTKKDTLTTLGITKSNKEAKELKDPLTFLLSIAIMLMILISD